MGEYSNGYSGIFFSKENTKNCPENMRTTFNIQDTILEKIRKRSEKENVSLTTMINRVLQSGLAAEQKSAPSPKPFKVRSFSTGGYQAGIDPKRLKDNLFEEETGDYLKARKK